MGRSPVEGFHAAYVCRHIISAGVKSAFSAFLVMLPSRPLGVEGIHNNEGVGTMSRRARALLVLEQAMLSVAGLLIGASAMHAAKGAGLAASSRQLCAFGALYAATVLACGAVCSWQANRRSALELLQAKE